VVEYALRDLKKAIGVSAYRLLEKLPAKLKGSLPDGRGARVRAWRGRRRRAEVMSVLHHGYVRTA
jgi:hypothetical protein